MTWTTSSTPDYTTKQVTDISPYDDVAEFFYEVGPALGDMYNFDFERFDFFGYARENLLWVCRRRKKVAGVMLARLYPSIWDPTSKVLWQDSLHCKKSSQKAAYLLLQEFIDFGRRHANICFTCRAAHTNIKEKSFERLGFKKSEELYIWEGRT